MTKTLKPAAVATAIIAAVSSAAALTLTAGLTSCGTPKPKIPLSVACRIPSLHLACPPGGHHSGQTPDLRHG